MLEKLLSDISSGNAVLFLGAGSIYGSTIGEKGKPPLGGDSLKNELQAMFFPEEGETRASLKRVSSNIQQLRGRQKFHQALVDLLVPVNPSGALKIIPKVAWHAIYTTNVDDSLERAYDQVDDKVQRLMPVVLPQDKAALERTTEVSYYKLHGCLRHPDSDVIFSHKDYTESREKYLKMFASLTADLCDFPFVFVGFSQEDDDFQDVWESVKKYVGSTRRSASTYLVQPKSPKSFVDAMELEDVSVIDFGVEDFFPWLKANLLTVQPSIVQRVRGRAAPIQALIQRDLGKNVDAELVDAINHNFEFVKQIPQTTYDLDKSRFLLGALPTWDDIKAGTPIVRDLESDLSEALSQWIEKPHFEMMLIMGGAGYGKSTLLKQFAERASKLETSLELLFLRQSGSVDSNTLSLFAKAIETPLIVFVDDAYRNINALRHLKEDGALHQLPILIIGTSRPADWGNARRASAFDIPNQLDLIRLSPSESQMLAKLMKRSRRLALSKQDISVADLADHYFIQCEKHLLAGLITSVSDEEGEFEEIIRNEYFRIQSEEAKKLYLAVALIHSLGLSTPAALACRVVDGNITNYHDKIGPFLETAVIEFTSPLSGDLMFASQQRVIAEALVREIMRPDNAVELIIKIAHCINPHQQEQYQILRRLYDEDHLKGILKHSGTVRSCFEQLIEDFPSDPFIKQHYAIFEADEKDFDRANQLIKDALSVQGRHPHFLNTQANILLKEAEDESDRERAEYLFSSGVELLRERLAKDNDKEIHLLSLIDRQVGWCRRTDLTEAQRLATLENAQADLDRVRPIYPLSSEINTAEAKLNLQLDHIPRAKNLLERSVRLDGSNSRARILLARILLKEDADIGHIRDLVEEGLKYDPYNYGLSKLKLDCVKKIGGEWPVLRRALEEYLKVAENDISERLNLLKGCIENGDLATASNVLKRLKRSNAPFGLKRNLFVPLMKGNQPYVVEGTYEPTGFVRGWLDLDGFPSGMNAFVDVINVLPSGKSASKGKRFKVELGINGFGLVVKRLVS